MSERMIQGESETKEKTTERTTERQVSTPNPEPAQEGGADRKSDEGQVEETEGR